MRSIERLSADDRVMLWPDALWPQEVAALAILDGERGLRLDTVRAVIGSRIHLVPRLRQLLFRPGRGLGGPLWVDAPTFDLTQHVVSVPVPPPGDEAALLQTVERLRRTRLDPNRPLWQMCVLTGLPDNRLGLFVKIHHAVADGIAALATIGCFLDAAPYAAVAGGSSVASDAGVGADSSATGVSAVAGASSVASEAAVPADSSATPVSVVTPDPAVGSEPSWWSQPWPTTGQLFLDNVHRHAVSVGHIAATLAHPGTVVHRLGAAWSQWRTFSHAPPDPPSSLDHSLSADRGISLVRASLDRIADTAHAHGATINDVLLAAIAAGLRALLIARGEPVDHPVTIDVPITLRPKEGRDQARGNRVAQMFIALPVHEADPDRRLELIAAQSASRKREPHLPAGRVLGNRLARRLVLKALRRHPVNVTSADLIGPPEPVYLACARVLEMFPVLPLMGNLCLGVGALSYAGQFTVGVIADRDAYPDLDVFTTGLCTELAGAISVPQVL